MIENLSSRILTGYGFLFPKGAKKELKLRTGAERRKKSSWSLAREKHDDHSEWRKKRNP
jgi:hypothetical protein